MPSFVLFVSMFGYLAFLIVLKWIKVRSDGSGIDGNDTLPKIMNIMIDMFLAPFSCCGDAEAEKMAGGQHDKYLDDRLYFGQPTVQGILFLLVVACVPVMLCGKPFMLWREHKQRSQYQLVVHADDNTDDESTGAPASVDDADDNETIEYRDAKDTVDAEPKSHADIAALSSAAGILRDDEPEQHGGGHGHGHGKEFDFGEIMMHQVLACVMRHCPLLY